MKRLLYLILSIILLIGMASAQSGAAGERDRVAHATTPLAPMEGDWWKNSEIARQINLTEQQRQELQQIFSEHRPHLVALRSDVEVEEEKLKNLVDQDQPRDDQVLAQVDQVSTARGKLDKEFAAVTLAFRKVLSADQWKQLQSFTVQKIMFFKHGQHRGNK